MDPDSDLPDLSTGIFATPSELTAVTSSAARQSSARRAGLQKELLHKFPKVSSEEFMRMLVRCRRCEHAISVGKFMQTQHCTACGDSIINPDGMFHLALRGLLRLAKPDPQDLLDFFREIPRV